MRCDAVKHRMPRARVHGANSTGAGFGVGNCQAVIRVTGTQDAPRPDLGTIDSGSYMPYSSKQILALGWLWAAILSSAACAPRRIPPMTVADLMEDRVTLDGVLMKCNQNPIKARTDTDCLNARIAIERLAQQQVDPAVEEKRKEEFERTREQLRLTQERLRQEQEAKKKVDAYSLPVVPVEPPPPKTESPPLAGTTTP
jgi:hypothetical protein